METKWNALEDLLAASREGRAGVASKHDGDGAAVGDDPVDFENKSDEPQVI